MFKSKEAKEETDGLHETCELSLSFGSTITTPNIQNAEDYEGMCPSTDNRSTISPSSSTDNFMTDVYSFPSNEINLDLTIWACFSFLTQIRLDTHISVP